MASRFGNFQSAFARNPAVGATAKMTGPAKGLPAPKGPPKGLVPGVAPGAPGGGPAAPAPSAAPMPWDANYETRVGQINRDKTNSLAGLLKEEGDVKQAYGFDDLSNPFSKLALLREKLANSQRGDTNSMAAAGQLYAGSIETQRGATQHGYDTDYDSTRRAYDADLNDIATRRTGVTNSAEDALTGAGWERTQAALTNRPDPASVPVPAAAAPAAPAAKPYQEQPGKNSKGEPGVWHIYPDGRKVFVRK